MTWLVFDKARNVLCVTPKPMKRSQAALWAERKYGIGNVIIEAVA